MTGDTLLITILSIAVTVESIVIGVMRSENQRLQRDGAKDTEVRL